MIWFKLALVVFATVPIFNKYVFHVENVAEVKVDVRERLIKIKDNIDDEEYDLARAACDSFILLYTGKKNEISSIGVQTAIMYKANSYSMEMNHDQAIKTYQELEEKYPQGNFAEHALAAIAQSYFAQATLQRDEDERRTSYRNALKYYEKIVFNREKSREFPSYANREFTPARFPISEAVYLEDMLIGIGRCYLKLKQVEKARESFNLVVTYFPGSDAQDDAQKYIGDSYLDQAQELTVKAAVEKDQSKQQEYLYDAEKYNRLALKTYQDFVNLYSQSDFKSDVLIAMGEVHFRLKEDTRAIEVFNEAVSAIKLPEEQAKVQIKIGNYYYNTKQYDEAINTYSKVIKNFPDSKIAANAQYLVGDSYEKKNQLDEAFTNYDRVCEFYKTSPFYAPSAFKLGAKLMEKKDYKGALSYFRKGLLLYPRSEVADQTQFMVGMCYKSLDDYRLAVKEFEYVLGEYPDSRWVEQANFQIGDCYNALNEKDKAREAFTKITTNQELQIEGMKMMGIDASNPDEQIKTYEAQLGSNNPEAEASAYMEIARIYFEGKKEYATALEKLDQAVALTQDQVKKLNIISLRAGIYSAMDNYPKSRELYLAILDDPKANEELKVQAEFKVYDAYRKEKEYPKAIEGFIAFVAKNPEHKLVSYAQFLLGVCYTELKQYTQAAAEYAKVVEKYPDSDVFDDAALSQGNSYRENGEVQKALEYWEGFITQHPGCDAAPQFYYQIADVYRERNTCAKAVEFYQKLIDNHPEHALYSPAAYQAGMCLLKMDEPVRARQTLELVRKEDAEFYKAARAEIGKLLAGQNYEQAIAEYQGIENAATTDDDKAMARLGIGDIYQNKAMYKQAAESYEIVVSQYLSIPEELRAGAFIKLIDANNNLKRYRDVIAYADKMIELFPANEFTINAVYFKANAYYSQKSYREAIQVFNEVITLNRNEMLSEISSYQKGECLLFQNKPEEAVREYANFQKKYPQSKYVPLSIYQQGNAYWGQEKFAQALERYNEVVNKYPDFSEIDMAMAFLGYCYDRTDDWQKAKALYQKVLKRNAKPEAVKFAKEQLEKINVIH